VFTLLQGFIISGYWWVIGTGAKIVPLVLNLLIVSLDKVERISTERLFVKLSAVGTLYAKMTDIFYGFSLLTNR
jgi:hypothetical protein